MSSSEIVHIGYSQPPILQVEWIRDGFRSRLLTGNESHAEVEEIKYRIASISDERLAKVFSQALNEQQERKEEQSTLGVPK